MNMPNDLFSNIMRLFSDIENGSRTSKHNGAKRKPRNWHQKKRKARKAQKAARRAHRRG